MMPSLIIVDITFLFVVDQPKQRYFLEDFPVICQLLFYAERISIAWRGFVIEFNSLVIHVLFALCFFTSSEKYLFCYLCRQLW